MRAFIVDDDKQFIQALKAKLIGKFADINFSAVVVDSGRDSSFKIAANVNREISNIKDDVIIFINLNLKCYGLFRQELAGAEVLKHLRLAENFYMPNGKGGYNSKNNRLRETHCVVYSFLNLEQILRLTPENLILLSEGVTFLQLPDDFQTLNLRKLAVSKPKLNNLHRFLKGNFALPDDRHEWANWWGIKQLDLINNRIKGKAPTLYSTRVYEELNELRSQQAIYLFNPQDAEIRDAYQNANSKIKKLRADLHRRKPRILHIDDKWQDGWSDVVRSMIYPDLLRSLRARDAAESAFETYALGGKPVFRSFKAFDVVGKDVDLIYKKIKKLFANPENLPDAILLDLRLFGESGTEFDIKNLSGAKLLKLLRQDYKALPIIMTTASNKSWSYEQLRQFGADAFWTKEGIDENRTAEATVKNYQRLLELISNSTVESYKFLRKFELQKISLLAKRCWWQNKKWILDQALNISETTTADKASVKTILDDVIMMRRGFLSQFVMGSGFQGKRDETLWRASILMHAAYIIEVIHFRGLKPFEQKAIKIGTGGFDKFGKPVLGRKDWFGLGLYEQRHDVAHFERVGKTDEQKLTNFLANLMCYLTHEPKGFGSNQKTLAAMRNSNKDYKTLFNYLLS
jgi:CheY-like chemotaxis protein